MISRREFLQMLALAAAGPGLHGSLAQARTLAETMYAPAKFGDVSLIHLADRHAQLLPQYYREPSARVGVGQGRNEPPFLVGEHLLERFRVMPSTPHAHALTHLRFEDAAVVYGKVGGVAHLATVVNQLRATRPDALLLDSGDSWVGSGLAEWTQGRDGAEVSRLLGVDAMTGDWEFALGADQLKMLLAGEAKGRTSFLAQNVRERGGGARPFRPHSIYFVGGHPVGVIGLAYPHIGRYGVKNFVPDWEFGLDEPGLQASVDSVRARGVRLVVLMSHAGLPADLKLAKRLRGVDVILSGHSHDPMPQPFVVRGQSNQTLVVSGGAHGKFLGLLDLRMGDSGVLDYRYSLLPIFSRLIKPDAEMAAAVDRLRQPYAARLDETLAITEGALYRRDTFKGPFDQLVLDILRSTTKAEIAIGPGYRFGATLLPGDAITWQHILDYTAGERGYCEEELSGAEIRNRLEAWSDEVFNPDPYEQSGEDMVRTAGLDFECDPAADHGRRIRRAFVGKQSLEDGRRYKVVSWGVRSLAATGTQSVAGVVADYLRRAKNIAAIEPTMPRMIGREGNLGIF
jgi:S-sulfosulfanyl-L-cysteine sulfohydrolase